MASHPDCDRQTLYSKLLLLSLLLANNIYLLILLPASAWHSSQLILSNANLLQIVLSVLCALLCYFVTFFMAFSLVRFVWIRLCSSLFGLVRFGWCARKQEPKWKRLKRIWEWMSEWSWAWTRVRSVRIAVQNTAAISICCHSFFIVLSHSTSNTSLT